MIVPQAVAEIPLTARKSNFYQRDRAAVLPRRLRRPTTPKHSQRVALGDVGV